MISLITIIGLPRICWPIRTTGTAMASLFAPFEPLRSINTKRSWSTDANFGASPTFSGRKWQTQEAPVVRPDNSWNVTVCDDSVRDLRHFFLPQALSCNEQVDYAFTKLSQVIGINSE